MSQDSNIVNIGMSGKKKFRLPDREKIIMAYHLFESNKGSDAIELLSSVDSHYYLIQFHRDIARALLCWAVRHTGNPNLAKESEFYLIVYRMTKFIVGNKLNFPKSGNFTELLDTLFKDCAL